MQLHTQESSAPFLLLTGTIEISVAIPYLRVRTTSERLVQYVNAIMLWVEYGFFKEICFCENSAYHTDWQPLIDFASSRSIDLEILQFSGNSELAMEKGKGYGEAEIIEYALENSRFSAHGRTFWKCTGRLYLENLESAEHGLGRVEQMFVVNRFGLLGLIKYVVKNIIRLRGHGHIYPTLVLTSYFRSSRDFYLTHLLGVGAEVDDRRGVYLEHLFYRRLRRKLRFTNGRVHDKSSVEIIGISATSGGPYDNRTLKEYEPKMGLLAESIMGNMVKNK